MLQSPSSISLFRGELMRKGDEDDGVRTVECLRGRLLAERAASKAAKDEADLMAKRLDELEKQLAEEIRFRDRAEKRLEHALKKLKSAKISNVSDSSRGSFEGWSIDSGTMEGSSGQCGSGRKMEEMRRELGAEAVGDDDGGLDSSLRDSTEQVVSHEGSWSSVGDANSWSKEEANQDDGGCCESITDGARQASDAGDEQRNIAAQHAENFNDMLALVPVKSTPASSSACHSDAGGDNVQNVLIALRQVKDMMQNSLERRAAALHHPKPLYGQL